MNLVLKLSLIAGLAASSSAFAQSDTMKGMAMKDKPMNDCMAMKGMKGMDMKDMDSQKCADMMEGMKNHPTKASGPAAHVAEGVVKSVDTAQGMVTLAHGPVKSLGWPAMTMGFAVKYKNLFDKLAVGKKVRVELSKEESDYVVTGVK